MRVMVTGATGFVGAHTAHALLAAGHEVTALVRDERRLAASMSPFDVPLPDAVVGDMTDATAVAAALDGADAVVHCAAVVSLDRRRAEDMSWVNPTGLRNVVGLAAELGLDPIVTTSSTSALFAPGVGVLSADSPVTTSDLPYARSKAECERIAREYQRDGAPVVITYPSGILGPAAGPALGETSESMAGFVAAGIMPTRRAALSFIDVRDLAAAHVALMQPGLGPRRIMCGGSLVTMDDLAELLGDLTGRRFRIAPVPPAVLRGAGRAVDLLGRHVALDTPMSEEGMVLVTGWQGTDDSTLHDLGIRPRPPRDTMGDALRAWRDADLVADRHLGAAAGTDGRPTLVSRVRSVKVPGRVLASRPFRAVAPKVLPPLHRFVLRATRGRTLLDSAAQPMLMLHTTGARSGQPRQSPIATVPVEEGKLLVVGSNFARETHPAWTHNLLAHPDATVVFRGETFGVTARLLHGDERSARWPELLEWYPGWDDYTHVTTREFRVFELTPRFP